MTTKGQKTTVEPPGDRSEATGPGASGGSPDPDTLYNACLEEYGYGEVRDPKKEPLKKPTGSIWERGWKL